MASFQVVVWYPEGKLWEERFYHGVVSEVGDPDLREWDGKDVVQVRLRVDYGDTHEVTATQCTHTMHTQYLHTQCTLIICHTQCTHTTHTERRTIGCTHQAHI